MIASFFTSVLLGGLLTGTTPDPTTNAPQKNIIQVTEKAFDDFAATGANEKLNRAILGID